MTPWESTSNLKAGLDAIESAHCDHTAVLIGATPEGRRIYWCVGCGAIRTGLREWTKPQGKTNR
jgi:hypothetical protein